MVGCRANLRPGEPVAGFAVGTMKPGSSSLTVEEFRRAVETANSSIADQDTYLEAFRLVERLNSKDLGMAAMVVRRVYIPGGVQPYLYAIYRRWAAEDVPAALANARSIPDRNEGYVALTAVFKTWSARDPAAVSQWLHTQSSARDLTLLLQTATPGLTAASPETAFLLIQSLGPWSRNSNYLQGITEGWAKTKPREALARLETVQAYPELVQEVVSMWACKDFQAAETWVKSQPRGETRRAGECGLVAALVLDDTKRATGMALALPKGRHQGAAVHALLELWVQLDVVGAANWVKQLPLGSLRNTALEQVFYYWGVVRPWDALDSIQSIPAGPDRDMVLAKIAEAWSVVDTKALAEWLVKLPTGPSKKADVSATIGMLMYANPAAAASLLGEAPKAIGRAHVLQIVGNWMEIDAPKAMEWVRSYPDTSVREEAYAKFAHSSWARQCPTQALAVLTELPPGRFQGEGFRTLVANWA